MNTQPIQINTLSVGQKVTRNGEIGQITRIEKNHRIHVNFEAGFSSLLHEGEFELVAEVSQIAPIAVGQIIQGENCYLIVTKLNTVRAEENEAKVIPLCSSPKKEVEKLPVIPAWFTLNVTGIKAVDGILYADFGTFSCAAFEACKFDSFESLKKSFMPETPKKPAFEVKEEKAGVWIFTNEKTYVTVDMNKFSVSGSDKTDMNNEPRFYNKTSRSLKKALESLKEGFGETTTMYGAMGLVQKFVKCRSYCAMD